jgi:hypothetical protein
MLNPFIKGKNPHELQYFIPLYPIKMVCSDLILYGFNLSYANLYDEEWITFVSHLKVLFSSQRNFDEITKLFLMKSPTVNILPSENISMMMSYMDANSLCNSASVNKKWNHLVNNPIFWENLCKNQFNTQLSCFYSSHNYQDSKSLYRIMTISLRNLLNETPTRITNSVLHISRSSWRSISA